MRQAGDGVQVRSRDCEKCNVITSKMRDGCYGLRQHGGSMR